MKCYEIAKTLICTILSVKKPKIALFLPNLPKQFSETDVHNKSAHSFHSHRWWGYAPNRHRFTKKPESGHRFR
jgi:hypothetical protein